MLNSSNFHSLTHQLIKILSNLWLPIEVITLTAKWHANQWEAHRQSSLPLWFTFACSHRRIDTWISVAVFCDLIETCLYTNSRCLCPLVKYTFHWMGKGGKQRTSTFVICSKICQHDFCVTLTLHFASVSTHFAVLCVLFCSSSGFCRCFFSGFEYSSRRTRWSRNRRHAALVGGPPALS